MGRLVLVLVACSILLAGELLEASKLPNEKKEMEENEEKDSDSSRESDDSLSDDGNNSSDEDNSDSGSDSSSSDKSESSSSDSSSSDSNSKSNSKSGSSSSEDKKKKECDSSSSKDKTKKEGDSSSSKDKTKKEGDSSSSKDKKDKKKEGAVQQEVCSVSRDGVLTLFNDATHNYKEFSLNEPLVITDNAEKSNNCRFAARLKRSIDGVIKRVRIDTGYAPAQDGPYAKHHTFFPLLGRHVLVDYLGNKQIVPWVSPYTTDDVTITGSGISDWKFTNSICGYEVIFSLDADQYILNINVDEDYSGTLKGLCVEAPSDVTSDINN